MKTLAIDDPGDSKDTGSEADDEKMSPARYSMDTVTESLKGEEAAAPLFEKTEEKVTESPSVMESSESLGILKVSKSATDEPEKKIGMVDFAGQCSYYSSHQIFLSPRAFFILVLNMEKNFDEMVGEEVCSQERSIYRGYTHRDYLTFWTKSIHQYSSEKAPILLVGTHAEQKTDQEKVEFFFEIWKTLETKTKSLQKHLDSKREFAIGFHENEGIEKIKESIVDVVRKLDHWGKMLPHSWAMFENFFQEKKYLKIINKRILLGFNEALPQDIKLETEDDINTMLQFFHDIREILYFNQEFLREMIILDVQWFADAFKK
ncbi:probable serine/threonine-protein kinase pats1 [Saccostrea cucullata]|uniref:probable serine/threonine-protein kinase pats1 n=1 Tax=Saccostrea cuccullata TaxID=36930 RepID=UPI002ED4F496